MSGDNIYTYPGDYSAIPKFFSWLNQGLQSLYPDRRFEAAGVLMQHLLVVLIDGDKVLAFFDIGEELLGMSDISARVDAGLKNGDPINSRITRDKWKEWMQ